MENEHVDVVLSTRTVSSNCYRQNCLNFSYSLKIIVIGVIVVCMMAKQPQQQQEQQEEQQRQQQMHNVG